MAEICAIPTKPLRRKAFRLDGLITPTPKAVRSNRIGRTIKEKPFLRGLFFFLESCDSKKAQKGDAYSVKVPNPYPVKSAGGYAINGLAAGCINKSLPRAHLRVRRFHAILYIENQKLQKQLEPNRRLLVLEQMKGTCFVMGLLISLITGAVIGWIAGGIMGSKGGLLRNIVLGIVGSGVGGFLAELIGLHGVGLGGLLISVAGACLVIFVCRKLF